MHSNIKRYIKYTKETTFVRWLRLLRNARAEEIQRRRKNDQILHGSGNITMYFWVMEDPRLDIACLILYTLRLIK